jgi:serine/threonine-protein kinase
MGKSSALGHGLPSRFWESRVTMTQGRKPFIEADGASTLFEPSKESSGLTAAGTPPPPGTPSGGLGPGTGSPTSPTSAFASDTPLDSSGSDDLTAGDLPSLGGVAFSFDSSAPLTSGQVLFDRYIVERELGRGGMGIVLLVRHREFDSERALKLIISGIARDPQARARFRREARILDRLNHPNAVRVYDMRMGQDVAFIEMEYVRGKSLNQVLVEGVPMPLDWVVDLLDQLCSVLQAASDEGIIHRDLKPQNLMLVEGRQPGTKILKLLDFGIAKIREGADDVRTLTGSFMGTPLYSSPEQIVGEQVDSRSDIYSVGLILCELLTGYRPFDGTMNAVIYKHTMVPPPSFAELNPAAAVPPQVEEVVRMCLAKEPAQRPQTLRELSERFHHALAGTEYHPDQPPVPKAVSPSQTFETKAISTADTKIRLVLALATVSLLLLLVAAILIRNNRLPTPPAPPKVTGSPALAPKPKIARGADAREVARQVGLWKNQGYDVDESAGKSPSGWPAALIRGSDNVKFARDPSGVYLPPGYTPSSTRAEDGKPRTLERIDGKDEVTAFSRIVGGKFRMGSLREDDSGAAEGQVAPLVKLSGFYMQQTEVTNGEIEAFINTYDPPPCEKWRTMLMRREKELGPVAARRLAASNIPWRIAAEYAQEKKGRLPTEAQWEYAARSQGQRNVHVWGNGMASPTAANISNYKERPDAVGSYTEDVTAQGIRDLTGNVREWCRDVWKEYEASAPGQVREDPQNPPPNFAASDSLSMVVRGGSYITGFEQGKTTERSSPREGSQVTDQIGFRIVIECPEGPPDPR